MNRFLLPANLGTLSALAADRTTRFTLGSVHVRTNGDGTYRAEATDGRRAAIVTGPCDPQEQFPAVPQLEAAPNGECEALIPGKDWQAAFKAVPKAKVTRGKPILGNVCAVLGREVSTLATADLETQTVLQPRNAEGRFPAIDNVIPAAPPKAVVDVNPALLAELLKVAAGFTSEDSQRLTLEVRDGETPLVLRCERNGHTFTGLFMPLGPAR